MTERWSDSAFLLRVSPFHERDYITEWLTEKHGRVRAISKFGATSKQRAIYQSGNQMIIDWHARSLQHMGQVSAELVLPYFALLSGQPWRWLPAQSAAALAGQFLYEHDRADTVFHAMLGLYEKLADSNITPLQALAEYAFFETVFLAACGFALDITSCAATGTTEELYYISPKSGRAVSRSAGEPYHDRLFRLPSFYCDTEIVPTAAELLDALAVNAYFLHRRLCEERVQILPAVRRQLEQQAHGWLR